LKEKKCEKRKKLKSTTEMLRGLYEMDTEDLCKDELRILYKLIKHLHKKIKETDE